MSAARALALAAGWQGGDDVVGLQASGACRLAQRGEVGHDLRELAGVFEVDRHEALEPGGPAQRPGLAVEPRDSDRHGLPLNRPGNESHAVDRVVVPPVLHRLT